MGVLYEYGLFRRTDPAVTRADIAEKRGGKQQRAYEHTIFSRARVYKFVI